MLYRAVIRLLACRSPRVHHRLSSARRMTSSRHLLITADDMGYCRERDQGIIDCYKAKVVSRASLMVNGITSETAAIMAREVGLPVGLHFNITEGSPISEKKDIPSLLTKRGYFHGKPDFPKVLAAGDISMDEVVIELVAQVKKFKQLLGYLPLHSDGHHHIHVLPGIAEVYSSTLSNLGVTWARLPVEDTDYAPWVDPKLMPFYVGISEQSKLTKQIFSTNGISSTDHFIGMLLMGNNLSADRIQDALSRVFQLKRIENGYGPETHNDDVARSCELMVHPGYPCTDGVGGCGEGPDDFAQSPERLHEINVLRSEQLWGFLEKHNIKLTTFPS